MATIQITESFSNLFVSDVLPTQVDRAAMEADNELIARVWFNGESLPSGLVKANIIHWYGGNDFQSGEFVQNLCVDAVELVTNGSFDTNMDGWTDNTVVSVVEDGRAKITVNSGSSSGRIAQLLTTSGNTNLHIAEIKADTGTASSVRLYTPTLGFKILIADGVTMNRYFYYPNTPTEELRIYVFGEDCVGYVDYISVREVTASEITNYTEATRTTYKNKNVGMSNLLLTQNTDGRPTGIVAANTIGFENSGDAVGNTGFKPSIDRYTIIEVVTLSTGVIEYRELKHHSVDGDSYKVNNVTVTTPTMPDADTALVLDDTAVIGAADVVSYEKDYFKVYTRVLTETESTEDFEAWILANGYELRDESNEILTDESGDMLYTIE